MPHKLLVVADLDYTVFDYSKSRPVAALGSEQYWVELFTEISGTLMARKVTLIFAVVTNKSKFDDIAAAGARIFQSFLSNHNPEMIIHKNDQQWCLVNLNHSLCYESIHGCDSMPVPSDSRPDLLSHFVVIPSQSKAQEIKKIADHHEIPIDHCVLLDDTPSVIAEAASAGINTVSFDCFHPRQVVVPNLDDQSYVNDQLNQKKSELIECVTKICDAIEGLSLSK